jgi:hypothetical protein
MITMDHTSTSFLFLLGGEKGLELWLFTPIFQSLKSVLLVKETEVPGENHWPAAND